MAAPEPGVDSYKIGREAGLGLAAATGSSARPGPHRVLADDAAGQTPAANPEPMGRERAIEEQRAQQATLQTYLEDGHAIARSRSAQR
jgi:hypothetical protein